MDTEKQKWEIVAKRAQMDFLKSTARYPAFVGGWGTGKTLFAILKCLQLCKKYPANLGLIARKEYTDLRDSTIQDFQKYTQLKIKEQHKEIEIPATGSKILFRHADEFNALQNINLGFFFLEQADEIEDENIFDFLRGRLRRGTFQQGILTANATDTTHWLYKRYKENTNNKDYALFEMTTIENADNLPELFLNDLTKLQSDNPAIFDRYVANIWGVNNNQFLLLSPADLESLKGVNFIHPHTKKIIAIDPSGGGDECPLMYIANGELKDILILHEKDTMKIVGHAMLFAEKYKCNNFAIDVIGLGKGVADRLVELNKKVIAINSSEKSSNSQFYNKRAEMYFYTAQLIRDRKIPYIFDAETRKQLSSIRYDPKTITSGGGIKLEPKDVVKKRLGYSPDRGDCFVYGQWGLQFVEEERKMGGYEDYEEETEKISIWAV